MAIPTMNIRYLRIRSTHHENVEFILQEYQSGAERGGSRLEVPGHKLDNAIKYDPEHFPDMIIQIIDDLHRTLDRYLANAFQE